mmetsp:Transcript_20297/g.58028  ORF Transcript_20297/g.58028 Transcript_20297/m.58028 type:complete len:99 (-) Transcript_20297:4-300(-)
MAQWLALHLSLSKQLPSIPPVCVSLRVSKLRCTQAKKSDQRSTSPHIPSTVRHSASLLPNALHSNMCLPPSLPLLPSIIILSFPRLSFRHPSNVLNTS